MSRSAAEAERLQSADDLRRCTGAALAALTGTDDEPTGFESSSALTQLGLARRATDELAAWPAATRPPPS